MSWIIWSTVAYLSSSPEFPLKINPTVGSPFILDLLYPLLFVLPFVILGCSHTGPLHRRRGKQNYKSCAGVKLGCRVLIQVLSKWLFSYSVCPLLMGLLHHTMLTWMCLPPTPCSQRPDHLLITRKHLTYWWSLTQGAGNVSLGAAFLGSWWAKLISIPSKNHSLL